MLEHGRVRLAEKERLAAGGGRDRRRDGAGAGDLEAAALVAHAHWIRVVRVRCEEVAFGVDTQTHASAHQTSEIHMLSNLFHTRIHVFHTRNGC